MTLEDEFRLFMEDVRRVTSKAGPEVSELLRDGASNPLGTDEMQTLLTRIVSHLRTAASHRGDEQNVAQLDEVGVERLVERAMKLRTRVRAASGERDGVDNVVDLFDHNGVGVGPVRPSPVFHEKEVAMNSGYLGTRDIKLWEGNERLETHIGQFKAKHGRSPTAQETLRIMLGQMPLEGLDEGDQFDILELARSIAANGVRKPPIIDLDGTLLDGNRRVAACYLILNDTKEFTVEEKARVENIFAWQLTPHATEEDRQRVIVSLNFESDCKKEWPDYIKARKVYEEWQAILAMEPNKPGRSRQAELKKELSRKYALGPDTTVVARYIKMIEWASLFEEHHINERNRDVFSVKHAADKHFQYFDELSKGGRPGGVAWNLEQDDNFRAMVFDMLFDGKFQRWSQVRDLKHVRDEEEAFDRFAKAHSESDVEAAQEHLDDALAIAKTRKAEARSLGANARIASFAKWLEELPPRAFRDHVRTENLAALLKALRIVEPIVNKALELREEDQ